MASQSPLVLIVDDDESLGQMLAWDLEELGYRVNTVSNVHEALAQLGSRRPDLVLLDYRLPDGSGLDILEVLAKQNRPPPAIIISGESEAGLDARCRDRGAREFLRKPVKSTMLDRLIRTLRPV